MDDPGTACYGFEEATTAETKRIRPRKKTPREHCSNPRGA